jgi:hypothetical protein
MSARVVFAHVASTTSPGFTGGSGKEKLPEVFLLILLSYPIA